MNIEDITQKLSIIAPANENVWTVEVLVDGRLYLSRSERGLPALFLEGGRDSFGVLPPMSLIQHSEEVTALPDARRLHALRILGPDIDASERVLAHIAYELFWRLRESPGISNQDLLGSITWLLVLLGAREAALSDERQVGLVGELIFLRRLLQRAHATKIPITRALESWTGADKGKRDFYARGVALEVKATGQIARLHQITSLNQLAAQESEEAVFLFSVGIRKDPTAPKKLTQFVLDIEALLVNSDGTPHRDALVRFRSLLFATGFAWEDRVLYERGSGFLAPHLPPELYRVENLRPLTIECFVDGRLPETVRSISYVLEVTGDPMSATDAEQVLNRLLLEPTV